MPPKPKILAFAGSARRDSLNKKLVRIAAEGASLAGGQVNVVDLRDYPMPLFDQEHEAEHGLPDAARKFKDLMLAHDGFLIASPEHNSTITALLKNTIDWTSRHVEGEPPLACFTGKVAVVMSASPGGLGGLRGLVHLRAILGNLGTLVLPATKSISHAHDAFADDGALKDHAAQSAVEQLGADLVGMLAKMLA